MIDKVNLGMDIADKAITHSTSLFTYMREPRSKAEEVLIDALNSKQQLSANDIEAAAMQLLVRRYVKRIKNHAAIMSKAESKFQELLDSFDNKETAPEPAKPDDEWLEYFFDMSSRVSDDVVQEIWARLLISEHIDPGSVKKVMLNTLALLDSTTAGYFTDLCKLVYKLTIDNEDRIIPLVIYDSNIDNLLRNYKGDNAPFEKYKDLCPDEDELELLEEIGLVTTTNLLSSTYKIYFPEESTATFECDGFSKTINGSYNDEDDVYEVQTGFVFFTQVGRALFSTLHIESFEGLAAILDRFIDSQSLK